MWNLISVIPFGMLTDVKEVQLEKTESPIWVTDSRMIIDLSKVQL